MCLRMNVTFKGNGSVEIDMQECIRNTLKEFPNKLKTKRKSTIPASTTMFSNDMSGKLDKHRSELFHRFAVMVLFVCERPRLDSQPIVATPCTRTKAPSESDWLKLVQMMNSLTQ